MFLDRDIDIMSRNMEIEMMKAESVYETTTALLNLEMGNYYEDGNEQNGTVATKKKSSFVEFIRKIFNTIIKTITNVFSGIINIFKRPMSPDEFFEDPNVQIKLEGDMNKLCDAVENETLKGRKIIQAISRGTGLNDKAVADWVDNSAQHVYDNFDSVAGTVISASTALATSRVVSKKVQQTAKIAEDCRIAAENIDTSKMDEKSKKRVEDAIKVSKEMGKIQRFFLEKSGKFLKNLEEKRKKKIGKKIQKISDNYDSIGGSKALTRFHNASISKDDKAKLDKLRAKEKKRRQKMNDRYLKDQSKLKRFDNNKVITDLIDNRRLRREFNDKRKGYFVSQLSDDEYRNFISNNPYKEKT